MPVLPFMGVPGCLYALLDSLCGTVPSNCLADREPLLASPPALLSCAAISSLYLYDPWAMLGPGELFICVYIALCGRDEGSCVLGLRACEL